MSRASASAPEGRRFAARCVARFSRLGEHGAIWLALGAAAGALDAPERRPQWQRATAGVAGAYALNTALKLVVRRRRPAGQLTSAPTQLSFPSAHAATSFAAARGFSRAGAPAAPLYALAGALAVSRLYLGMHYPSDVIAGALLGTAVGELAARR